MQVVDSLNVYAECAGTHDEDIAQAIYDVAVDYLGVEGFTFSVTIDDGEENMEYTFANGAWMIPPR